MRQIQHRVRDIPRCHAMRGLEARHPATYGGLGDGVDGEACRAALRVVSTELQASLLRGLPAGALWTAARVRGHNMRATSSCPGCGSYHEDEAHVLWRCPLWEIASAGWRAWVLEAAERLQLGPPTGWPATLGAVRGGGPPAGGRGPIQAVRDVPRVACGQIRPHPLGGAGAGRGPLPAAPGAGRQCDSARASRRGGRGSRRSPRTWSARQRPSDGRMA